jgi:hypothetical protein
MRFEGRHLACRSAERERRCRVEQAGDFPKLYGRARMTGANWRVIEAVVAGCSEGDTHTDRNTGDGRLDVEAISPGRRHDEAQVK